MKATYRASMLTAANRQYDRASQDLLTLLEETAKIMAEERQSGGKVVQGDLYKEGVKSHFLNHEHWVSVAARNKR